MLKKYTLTSRQFIIGGIVLFVLMLLINLSFALDPLLQAVSIFVGVFGLVLAGIFAFNHRPKAEQPDENEQSPLEP